jgi:hypothetical protein
MHPDVGYFNLASRRFPSFPVFAHMLTRLGMSDMPTESQKIWDRFWDCEDDVMRAGDAKPEVVSWYRKKVRQVLWLRGAERFLAKYPRLSLRLDWIDSVFPGALFVYIIRDWRAVVNSTVLRKEKRQRRGGGWFGVRIPGWKEMSDVPMEVAAGRQYRYVAETLEKMETKYGDRFFKIYYGELCKHPVETIRYIAEACDLRWTDGFEMSITRRELHSANHKWRTQLHPSQLENIRAEEPDFFDLHEEGE